MRISDWSSDVCSSDLKVKTVGLFDGSGIGRRYTFAPCSDEADQQADAHQQQHDGEGEAGGYRHRLKGVQRAGAADQQQRGRHPALERTPADSLAAQSVSLATGRDVELGRASCRDTLCL